ncbi:MAG: tRNA preQ1(34) S-adenosylmethionine ribosyltransferase-isomerase QueA [Gammaproteobacteria bacterium]|nr:MAG: tRNA preQ1(34) S-adenosylmethionine ribosyltransferase-isomerase QueA [Gammaproteobacteria bacterium]
MPGFNKRYRALPYTLSDFDFDLPEELIAQVPAKARTASRLLKVEDETTFIPTTFTAIDDELMPGDVLVVNNTKVIPARLFGKKISGGQLEIFVERIHSDRVASCMIRSNRSPKVGSQIHIANQSATVVERQGVFFVLKLDSRASNWFSLTRNDGDIPLPPYIRRQTNADDLLRYQTVYAEKSGAVAAPTAGLHFDDALLSRLRERGIDIVNITLHVGAGTFQPVKAENLDEHQMHFELFEIPEQTKKAVNLAKRENRRVIAVGTTSIRALESAAQNGTLVHSSGDTNLFIRPGFPFEIVDGLITNFHLPKSSLLMLVSAFAGYETIKSAYQFAINKKFRFFSYGDAMFLKCFKEK